MADLHLLPGLIRSRIRTARNSSGSLAEELADLDFGDGDLEGCMMRAEHIVALLRQALEWQEQLEGEKLQPRSFNCGSKTQKKQKEVKPA